MTTASIHARHLRLTLGRTVVFDDTELQLAPGWRVGLVGPNGVGKSTLLRVLAGRQPVDAGTVTAMPSDATVGYLPQEPDRRDDESVAEFLGRRTGVTAATMVAGSAPMTAATGKPSVSSACEAVFFQRSNCCAPPRWRSQRMSVVSRPVTCMR